MRSRYLVAAIVLAGVLAGIAPAGAAERERPSACKITQPPEGWPDGTSAGFDTNLHHGHYSDWSKHVRPVGKVKAAMLFVDFPNARAEDNADGYDQVDPYYDFLVPQAVEWFATSSYGRFRLDVEPVRRWYRMSQDDTFYKMGRGELTPETQRRYVAEVVRLVDADVDFSDYDIVYIVPPRNAAAIPFSPEYNEYTGAVVADDRAVKNGVTFGQDMWNWGFKIVNHETGHDISLPESYNASGVGGTHKFVGGWDLMGNILGRAPELMAWNKWKLEWLKDNQVDCVTEPGVTTHRLSPIEVPGKSKMVVVRTGRYTAWIAELRRALGNDAATICDPGVLIYKLDASIPNGDGSIQVHDAAPGSGNQGPCRELDIGTLGVGAGKTPIFSDPATGVTIQVVRDDGEDAVVGVIKSQR